MSIHLYPAIDVRNGRVVRLAQGDYARETRYAADPFALAMAYADAGAESLHLVDLDAAREGGYTLLPLLARIKSDGRLRVQTGGGVGTEETRRRGAHPHPLEPVPPVLQGRAAACRWGFRG